VPATIADYLGHCFLRTTIHKTSPMSTFIAVDDQLLAERISSVSHRIVFVAPAVSKEVATALGGCFRKADRVSITLVLDPDEDAHRLGYGDREGLQELQKLAQDNHIGLRSHPGLRIGLLLADDEVLIWSPTPKAVEHQRDKQQPNGIDLGGVVERTSSLTSRGTDQICRASASDRTGSLAGVIRDAIAADDSDVLLGNAEIGCRTFTPEQVAKTIAALKENPPAPFDLSVQTRVFSTKFQFVETELRGAAWTTREVKISSLLLNPDVLEDLQELFETRVRPFSAQANLAVEVPTLVQGKIAYTRDGEPILSPMTQADIEKGWKEILKRYLRRLEGFGWLISRAEKQAFEATVAAYETVLKQWVAGFRKVAADDEETLANQLVDIIKGRAQRSTANDRLKDIDIKATVAAGIQKLRVTEPSVKLVFKEISWESTRDGEFTNALRKAVPAEQLKDWFEVFTAARERGSSS